MAGDNSRYLFWLFLRCLRKESSFSPKRPRLHISYVHWLPRDRQCVIWVSSLVTSQSRDQCSLMAVYSRSRVEMISRCGSRILLRGGPVSEGKVVDVVKWSNTSEVNHLQWGNFSSMEVLHLTSMNLGYLNIITHLVNSHFLIFMKKLCPLII